MYCFDTVCVFVCLFACVYDFINILYICIYQGPLYYEDMHSQFSGSVLAYLLELIFYMSDDDKC